MHLHIIIIISIRIFIAEGEHPVKDVWRGVGAGELPKAPAGACISQPLLLGTFWLLLCTFFKSKNYHRLRLQFPPFLGL